MSNCLNSLHCHHSCSCLSSSSTWHSRGVQATGKCLSWVFIPPIFVHSTSSIVGFILPWSPSNPYPLTLQVPFTRWKLPWSIHTDRSLLFMSTNCITNSKMFTSLSCALLLQWIEFLLPFFSCGGCQRGNLIH